MKLNIVFFSLTIWTTAKTNLNCKINSQVWKKKQNWKYKLGLYEIVPHFLPINSDFYLIITVKIVILLQLQFLNTFLKFAFYKFKFISDNSSFFHKNTSYHLVILTIYIFGCIFGFLKKIKIQIITQLLWNHNSHLFVPLRTLSFRTVILLIANVYGAFI